MPFERRMKDTHPDVDYKMGKPKMKLYNDEGIMIDPTGHYNHYENFWNYSDFVL